MRRAGLVPPRPNGTVLSGTTPHECCEPPRLTSRGSVYPQRSHGLQAFTELTGWRVRDSLPESLRIAGPTPLGLPDPSANWLYRMISTKASLPEKVLVDQIRMFRHYGMGSLRTLLVKLSKGPGYELPASIG